MIYWQLFLSFIQIGLFSFGGGYAAMPLIQGQVVTLHHWLNMEEFTNLITISEMTPGPIAINSATFVGMKIAGVPGALVATLGCILPACILVTVLAKLYLRYRNLSVLQSVLHSLRPAVVALIAAAGVSILLTAFWGTGAAVTLDGTNWRRRHSGWYQLGPCGPLRSVCGAAEAVPLESYSGHGSGRCAESGRRTPGLLIVH